MAVKTIYGVGLDAGSRRTRCVICALEEGGFASSAMASPSRQGWLKGTIADQSAVAESDPCRATRGRRQRAGISVEGAVVGMGGPTVRGGNCARRGGTRLRARD